MSENIIHILATCLLYLAKSNLGAQTGDTAFGLTGHWIQETPSTEKKYDIDCNPPSNGKYKCTLTSPNEPTSVHYFGVNGFKVLIDDEIDFVGTYDGIDTIRFLLRGRFHTNWHRGDDCYDAVTVGEQQCSIMAAFGFCNQDSTGIKSECRKSCGTCNVQVCPRGQVQCNDRNTCYDVAQKCDTIKHCIDGSDELDCPGSGISCKFEAISSNECPSNPDLSECSFGMDDNELCEADSTLPDGNSNYNIDNCGTYDVFKCDKDQIQALEERVRVLEFFELQLDFTCTMGKTCVNSYTTFNGTINEVAAHCSADSECKSFGYYIGAKAGFLCMDESSNENVKAGLCTTIQSTTTPILPLPTAPVAGRPCFIGESNTLCSHSIHESISTMSRCMEAVHVLSQHGYALYFNTEQSNDEYPNGCYLGLWGSGEAVFYNTKGSDTARADVKPICKYRDIAYICSMGKCENFHGGKRMGTKKQVAAACVDDPECRAFVYSDYHAFGFKCTDPKLANETKEDIGDFQTCILSRESTATSTTIIETTTTTSTTTMTTPTATTITTTTACKDEIPTTCRLPRSLKTCSDIISKYPGICNTLLTVTGTCGSTRGKFMDYCQESCNNCEVN